MRYDVKAVDPFYQSSAWRALRKAALIRDHYWCQRCKCRQANTVHHKLPRETHPDLALDIENLESVCAQCHNQEHPEKGRRKKPEELPEGIRVIVVE